MHGDFGKLQKKRKTFTQTVVFFPFPTRFTLYSKKERMKQQHFAEISMLTYRSKGEFDGDCE